MKGPAYSTIPPSCRDYGWLHGPVIGKDPLPPLNLQQPVISGLVAVGSTIAVSQGSWRTSPPTSYRYQWLRNGTAVADATVSSYLLVQADLSATMTATVTAINPGGSASASASGVGPVAPAPVTVPVNTALPVISGTPQVGSTLTASTGTWTGSPAYAYQWLRNGAGIGGATGNSYLLVAADLAATITVTVTASNSAGFASATSAGVGPVSGTAPVNTVLPVISGTTQVGSTLATTNGNWTGTPAPAYTYQWTRNGAAIGGATSNNYALVTADAAATIAVTVTASNSVGSAAATSAGVGPVLPAAPVNTAVPVISGSAQVGSTLTTSNGTWTGSPTFLYQWLRGGVAIGGATASTYLLVTADLGATIAVTVTGTNAGGSASATSAGVGPVASANTTWNPTDLNSVTLSGSNLVATVGAGTGGVRGTNSYTSGKYYWEATYTLINSNGCDTGIALASADVTGTSGANIAFIARSTGGITVNSVASGSALGIIAQGSIIGIAVDFTAKLIWFRVAPAGNWNGSGTANPATGTGGINIASISTGPLFPIFFGQGGDKVTANFGASAFSGAIPSGFSSWGG